ncbi:hypothetical protein [Alteromonas sp. BMJM2]|uniref:hypothetical protein n=1 Tax=Alteromonas sp. BMJM2 TaxID=2954241 RepID=UPI0022B5356D|nr:hypothetical protein [Alteromonas sp. BMJM2]
MVSPLSTDKNTCAPDILDVLVGLPPSAQVLFIQIKMKHNYINNVCSYELSESVQDKTSTAYKLYSRYSSKLVKAGLLVRLKADHRRQLGLPKKDNITYFLINPYLVRCKEYALADSIWKQYS